MSKGSPHVRRHGRLPSRQSVLAAAALLALPAGWAAAQQVVLDHSRVTYSANNNGLGVLIPAAGAGVVELYSPATRVTFAGLAAPGQGATLHFEAYPAEAQTMPGTHRVFLTGQPAGPIGPWAFVNGRDLAVYDPAVGVRPMAVGAGAGDHATTFQAGRHVLINSGTNGRFTTLAAGTAVSTLTLKGRGWDQNTLTVGAGKALTLDQGTLLAADTSYRIDGGRIAPGAGAAALTFMVSGSTLDVASEVVGGPGGIVKTGNGYLNLLGAIDPASDLHVQMGYLSLGDRTGQGAGRKITVAGFGKMKISESVSLGDYQLALGRGGAIELDDNVVLRSNLTIGQGGRISTDGTATVAGAITGVYQGGSTLSFSGKLVLGGGPTDTAPNRFATSTSTSFSSGTLSLNKAAGVTALAGDVLIQGPFSSVPDSQRTTLKLLADEQIADAAQVGNFFYSVFDLNGRTETIGIIGSTLNSEVRLNGGTLVFAGRKPSSVTAQGAIVGPGRVVSRGIGQTLEGPDAFTGELVVEDGLLTLKGATRKTTGGILLKGGVLASDSVASLGVTTNAVRFDGGTWRPAATGANPIEVLAAGGAIDTSAASASLLALSGPVSGTGLLRKTGANPLWINGAVTGAAGLAADAGTIVIRSAGRHNSTGPLRPNAGGTIDVDASAGVVADRVNDAAPIQLAGGTFRLLGAPNATTTETVGALAAVAGASTVSPVAGGSGVAALTFSSLAPRGGGGATVNFAAAGLGVSNQVFVTGHAPGFMGAWAVANGTSFAKYDPDAGVVALDAAADYAPDLTPDAHVRLTAAPAAPVAADLSVRTLTLATGAPPLNVNLDAGRTLTLADGGLLKSGPGLSTINAAPDGGAAITSGNGDLVVHASGGQLTIAAAVTGAATLTKSGDGTLLLTAAAGPNSFAGKTYVNQGTLRLAATRANATVGGDVVVNGGTLQLDQNEQIPDTATLTINPGGTFNLNARTETVHNFHNNGGTYLATGGRLIVNSPNTATFASGATTIGAGQTLDATGLRITGGTNVIAGGGTVNVFRTTPDGEVSGGLRLEGANPSLSAQGILRLGGVVSVNATGTASITTLNNAGSVDLRGSRTFVVNTPLDVSAVLTGGTLVKTGPATLRLSGPNVLAGLSIDQGDVEVTSPNALGSGNGAATLSGGRLLLRNDAAAVAVTASVAVARDGTIDLDRATTASGAATTGAFTFNSLTLGDARLDLTGGNGGSLTFTAPSTLTGNARVSTGVPLTLSGTLNETGGSFGLTKAGGPAPLVLAGGGANTYTGPTRIHAGDLELRKAANVVAVGGDLRLSAGATARLYNPGQIADTAAVTVSAGATLDLNNFDETVASLDVAPGATFKPGAAKLTTTAALKLPGDATIVPGPALGALTLGGKLTLARNPSAPTLGHAVRVNGVSLAAGAALDVGQNSLVIDYDPSAPASPLAAVRDLIVAGRLSSSHAAANSALALGYAEAGDALAFAAADATAPFLDRTTDATAVLVRVTLAGDATLDGAVDFNDLVKLAQNYNTPVSATTASWWSNGDFTGDGAVDFNDLVKLAQNYNTALPNAAAIPGATANFGTDLTAAFAAVPEPSSAVFALAASALTALRRRRRAR